MKKPPISGIYCFENNVNNKRYIGSSRDIVSRYNRHLQLLKSNKHVNTHFQSAINKYKLENFSFIILEECNIDDLFSREQYHIDSYNWSLLYNKTKFASGGGSDVQENPITIIDLKGNIVKEFKSGADIARFFGRKCITYSTINTPAITKRKYRMVTPEFLIKNKEEILTWKNYSNKIVHLKEQFVPPLPKYIVSDKEKNTYCYTLGEAGSILNLTAERVRQIITHMKYRKISEFFHENSNKTIKILGEN